MQRANRHTRKKEDTSSLSRAIECVRIHIMSNQSTVFSSFSSSSSLFPFSQRSHHQKLKWKHLIEKREINSNNYFYWDASLFTSWITHTHTLSLSNARILPSLPPFTHWVCTNRRVHSKMISKYNWSLLFFFRSFFFQSQILNS